MLLGALCNLMKSHRFKVRSVPVFLQIQIPSLSEIRKTQYKHCHSSSTSIMASSNNLAFALSPILLPLADERPLLRFLTISIKLTKIPSGIQCLSSLSAMRG